MSSDVIAVPDVQLVDGRSIPQLGLGVWPLPSEGAGEVVSYAIRAGYRMVDTAALYFNEVGVGEGVAQSGINRDEIFVTTKLPSADQGTLSVRQSLEASLHRLGLDYLNLYLIHWPSPTRNRYVLSWETMIELRDAGRTRSIGVSNFTVEHLHRLIDATGVVPAVNQIELHPRFQQAELRRFHAEHGIATAAWSPLALGAVLDDPTVRDVAAGVGKTPAQVVLRWHLQLGNVVIPKSATPSRIEENLRVFDFELDDDAMGRFEALDAGERIGFDPDTFFIDD